MSGAHREVLRGRARAPHLLRAAAGGPGRPGHAEPDGLVPAGARPAGGADAGADARALVGERAPAGMDVAALDGAAGGDQRAARAGRLGGVRGAHRPARGPRVRARGGAARAGLGDALRARGGLRGDAHPRRLPHRELPLRGAGHGGGAGDPRLADRGLRVGAARPRLLHRAGLRPGEAIGGERRPARALPRDAAGARGDGLLVRAVPRRLPAGAAGEHVHPAHRGAGGGRRAAAP